MGDYNQIHDYNSDTKQGVSPAKNILVISVLTLLLFFGAGLFLYRYMRGLEAAKAREPLFPVEKQKKIKKIKPEVSWSSRLKSRLTKHNRELSEARSSRESARLKSENAKREYEKMERFYKVRIKTKKLNNRLTLTPDLKEYYRGKPMTLKRLEEEEQKSKKLYSVYMDYDKKIKSLHYSLSRTKQKLKDLGH